MSKLSEFNFSNVKYMKPKKRGNVYLSKLLYDDNEVNMQLRRKVTLSGVYREGNKYYLDLLFDNENPRALKFVKLYKQLEMVSIKEIYKKYNEWMGVENNLEWEDVYTSFKSQLTETENINSIKFCLLTNKNMMETVFYNEELEKISYKDVEEGDEVSLIVSFRGIKFGKEKFENQWEILQVKVYKEESEIEEIEADTECIINVDSDEESVEDNGYESIDVEDLEDLEKTINEKYKQYVYEESLKIIE